MELRLNHVWKIGSQIGEGGFGKVYLATSGEEGDAVVKLVPKDDGANRELLVENLSGYPNIMPVLEVGETDSHWAIVMPRADMSLREHLTHSGGRLSVAEAISVLRDIAIALKALDGRVIHRDIKPENILIWQGAWRLADFGISRYAAATTATHTQKFAWSRAYASPEQWRLERVSGASDVYAFGVVAYELFMGKLPFSGPSWDDFRQQHLGNVPPSPSNVPTLLQSLVMDCLVKAPEARPSPANILQRLENAQRPVSSGGALLQQANQAVVQKQAEESAQYSVLALEQERRNRILGSAKLQLQTIVDGLLTEIITNAPAAVKSQIRSSRSLSLGHGKLMISAVKDPGVVDSTKLVSHRIKFDVVATAEITVQSEKHDYGYEGRQHSLWFCDAQKEGVYRWFETGFMLSPLSGKDTKLIPFALTPDSRDAQLALSGVMHTYSVAYPFLPIDQGEEESFYNRWLT